MRRDINISGDLCGPAWGRWVHDFHNQEGKRGYCGSCWYFFAFVVAFFIFLCILYFSLYSVFFFVFCIFLCILYLFWISLVLESAYLCLEVNGDTVVHVGTISEDGALEMVNTLTKVFVSKLASLILISPGGWD